MQASLQLVDHRGCKYLTAAHVKKPADRTFVLTIAHTGARVSEVPAIMALGIAPGAPASRSLRWPALTRIRATGFITPGRLPCAARR